jgi:hypothetical protein
MQFQITKLSAILRLAALPPPALDATNQVAPEGCALDAPYTGGAVPLADCTQASLGCLGSCLAVPSTCDGGTYDAVAFEQAMASASAADRDALQRALAILQAAADDAKNP